MLKYLALLRINRNFAILSLIQLICYFSAWFSFTGIFTLLIELKAPVWAISLTAAMAFLPGVILAPFSGVIIDKFRPYPLLMLFMLIESITVLSLVFIDSLEFLWLLELIVFIRMGVGSMYFQVEMSLFPSMLSRSQLKLANEIHSIIWSVAYTAGMGLAGVFIHFFGVDASFVLDFCFYLFGAWLLTKAKLHEFVKQKTGNAFKMIKEGLVYLKQNPFIMHLIILHGFVAFTAYDALVALMADYKYKEFLSVSLIIGFMNMARAASLVVGSILLSRHTNNRTLFWLFIGQFFGILIWAFLQKNFYIGFLGLITAGFCTSVLWSYTYTLIQKHCDPAFYGRVVAYNDMVYLGIAAFASLGIGGLFKMGITLEQITIIMASTFLIAAIYYKILQRFFKALR